MNKEVALLKKYGHFDNPFVIKNFGRIGKEIKKEDLDNLNSPVVQAAIHSYQSFMSPEFEELTLKHHNRSAMFDGLTGPATEELLNMPRCGCPDYSPMKTEEATGSGSWPTGCNIEEPTIHSVKFHVTTTRMPSRIVNWWEGIKQDAINAYAEMGMLLVEVQEFNRAQITVWWEVLAGSTIGLAQLPGSGTCGVRVFCKLDPGYSPNSNQVLQLLAHEWGHNMNSGHISGDPIMHPSMTNQTWNKSFKGTAYGRRLAQFFGGEPVGPDDPEPEPEPPPEIEIPNGAKVAFNFNEEFARIEINDKTRNYRRLTDHGDLD